MGVLLAGFDDGLGRAVVHRLLEQGDDVRIILEQEQNTPDAWRDLGVHVATGRADDDDLVERAAQNVRTLVIGPKASADAFDPLLRGAKGASVGRVVVCGPRMAAALKQAVMGAGLEFVILETGGGTWRRRTVSPEALAEAVDAADDLEGSPALVLDLTKESSWGELKLDPPGRS